MVSRRQRTRVDSSLTASDNVFVDFAVINSGDSPVTESFQINLLVNGQLWESFQVPAPLEPKVYRFREDFPIGRLGIGTHTVRIVADAGDTVAESNESDNDYTKTIFVGGACGSLVTRVTPRGSGVLIRSQDPNCAGATVSISTLSPASEDLSTELGIAGEPLVEAQRTSNFVSLRERVRSEGRARVIVGLRNDDRPFSSATISLKQAEARTAGVARVQHSLLVRLGSHDLSSVRRFKFIPYIAMEVDGPTLQTLALDPEVVSIEEDIVVQVMVDESTALVGAPHAWSQGYTGAGQTVVILDTGVDKSHPFLQGRVVSEACFSGSGEQQESFCPGGAKESTEPGSARPCTLSDCFHGTAMAGVAAGSGIDFAGMAPDAGIIAVQVFSKCGDDCVEASSSDIIAGLERVLELSDDFDIAAVNMSFGGEIFSEECDDEFPATKAALDNLRGVNIAPVAASGNDGSDVSINYPACISSAISVGSVNGIGTATSPDSVSRSSNSYRWLDLLAPGRRITTSIPGGGYNRYSGTSLSVPHVTGAWALLKSKAPDALVEQLLGALKMTGTPVADSRNDLVKPRIQVDAALDAVIPPMAYAAGTQLTLTAQSNPGFRFARWRGCDAPSENRCLVEINANANVTAVFEPLVDDNPDLITNSLVAPPTATIGGEVSISSGIRNQGKTDAGPFRLGFYLSADPTITTEDTWFADCSYESGLPAGKSETCSRSFPIPPRVRPGRYYLGAIVDDLDRVVESSETNNERVADSGPIEVLIPHLSSRSFIPVVLTAPGLNDSFFTSELTLTNRGSVEARLDYTYSAAIGSGSGTASDVLAPGQQKIEPDAIGYLRSLGVPIPEVGDWLGTLGITVTGSSRVRVLVRTTTIVPDGRAGLAYPGIAAQSGFHAPVYLCGLRQNSLDRSNVAFQNMGSTEDGPVTLRTTVFSADASDVTVHVLEDVTLAPGGFHQYSGVLGTTTNGYVKVERVDGTAPFYAYGVINDQANSDGSFVFPVTVGSLEGSLRQTLPVIVETNNFTSELTVTNISGQTRTLHFSFVAEGLTTPDRTARFSLTLEPGQQRIIPDVIDTEMRRKGIEGLRPSKGGLAGALFATLDGGDMNGIVIGARTGTPDGRGGQYGLFYHAVPDGAALTGHAWVDGLQQDTENRSNLALVNTGEVDDSASVFDLDIYDGDTGRLVRTITTRPLRSRYWRQFNSILANHAPATTQGYVRIRKTSGNNPFLAYGVVNDGGAPGHRSGDGAYVPARE
ncbi:MAG: S8 family serine peptidase [Acidobacteriota bacterium]|nr:S8 family serine peptidase [Acidobacteriota bacterium]